MPPRPRPAPPPSPPPKRARAYDAGCSIADDGADDGGRLSTAAAATSPSPPPPPSDFQRTIKAWKWKREHLSDASRFHRPYVHRLKDGALSFKQAPYGPEGFASTVWDSSIVLARMVEARAAAFEGRAMVDLSAGVGVVAAVAAAVVPRAGRVVATDLAPNLPLLAANLEAAAAGTATTAATAVELRWGDAAAAAALGAFDVVFAADVSYIPHAVPALAASIDALTAPDGGVAYIAHGRNRGAWPGLRAALEGRGLTAALVGESELHQDCLAIDVDVWRCGRCGAEA